MAPEPTAPKYEPKNQTSCSIKKSQAKPLIVEWPTADRADLEAGMKSGLVVVKYSGCEMQLMSQCKAKGEYSYVGVTPKDESETIRSADELYAQMPLGAAKLEGKLDSFGTLTVNMKMVGKYQSSVATVDGKNLSGACDGATHVVAAMTAGAFEFYAGAGVEAGGGVSVLGAGAGAKSARQREMLARDGSVESCGTATSDDAKPPHGCGALVRIEVVPIQGALPNSARTAVGSPSGRSDVGGLFVTTSVAGASVVVDGRDVGVAPARIEELPRGTHRVEARGEGDIYASREVIVGDGPPQELHLELRKPSRFEVAIDVGDMALAGTDHSVDPNDLSPNEDRYVLSSGFLTLGGRVAIREASSRLLWAHLFAGVASRNMDLYRGGSSLSSPTATKKGGPLLQALQGVRFSLQANREGPGPDDAISIDLAAGGFGLFAGEFSDFGGVARAILSVYWAQLGPTFMYGSESGWNVGVLGGPRLDF